jgi:TPR repeat protein
MTRERSDLEQAIAFWTGTSGRRDLDKAHDLLTQAAHAGDPVARMWTAVFMNAGQCGFTKDPPKAFELASSAVDEVTRRARQRDPNALFILGVAELYDLTLDGNQESGFEKIRESAALGFPDALNSLGECYRLGRGTIEDPAKAVAAYRQAAELGHVMAQKSLAWCYRQGCGVKQDQKQSVAWYAKAAKRGDEWSQQYLAGLDEGSSYENGPYDGSSYAYQAPTYTTTPGYQSPTYPSYQSPAYSSYQSPTYLPNNSGSYLNDYTRNAAQTMHTNRYTYGSNSTNASR